MNRASCFPLFSAATAVCLVLMGCNSATSTTNPTPTATPSPANVSGDYTGTLDDAQAGNGTATATFAQTGTNAGGAITVRQSGGTIVVQTALAIAPSNATSGTMVVDFASGTTCSFSTSGTYDPSTGVLSGTYQAIANCSGDSGSYALTQQCTDAVTAFHRRIMTTPRC